MALELNNLFNQKEYDFKIAHPNHEDAFFYCKNVGTKKSIQLLMKNNKDFSKLPELEKIKAEVEQKHKFNLENFCEILVDWEGVTVDGKLIECNRENKELVFDKVTTLVNFLLKEVDSKIKLLGDFDLGN